MTLSRWALVAKPAVVKVEGVRQLRATMARAGHDLADFTEANAEVAALVARAGSTRAPRGRSGRLAGSVRGNRSKTRAVVMAGGGQVRYANAVHWGTGPRTGRRGPHNIAANPWLWNAAQDNQPRIVALYSRRVDAIVAKIKGAPRV